MNDNSVISHNNSTGHNADWDYDEAGNLVNNDVNTYEYDAAGRSGSVKQIGQSDSSRAFQNTCGYAPVGSKCEGNLYLGDRVLASQQIGFLNANGTPTSNSLQWEHIKI
jgi:YD repeat-containing protein